jgi:hypothetical protein
MYSVAGGRWQVAGGRWQVVLRQAVFEGAFLDDNSGSRLPVCR